MGRKDINGIYLSKNNYLMEMFNELDISITNKNIKFINNLSKDRNVNLMLVPTSTEILKDYLPIFSYNINQKKYLEYIENKLNTNVNFINPYNILSNHKDEYIYYLTDHHYTTLGAYYCYVEFCNNYGLTPIDIKHFNIKEVSNNFLGTLFSKIILKNQQKDSINIFELNKENKIAVDYMNKVTDTLYEFSYLNNPRDQYNIFLDNNHPLIKITTSIKNNKKICVVKDSYANSFIPFLTNHFEEIHVIDLRFYSLNINKYLNENNLNDILIFYNTKNFSEDRNLVFINNSN